MVSLQEWARYAWKQSHVSLNRLLLPRRTRAQSKHHGNRCHVLGEAWTWKEPRILEDSQNRARAWESAPSGAVLLKISEFYNYERECGPRMSVVRGKGRKLTFNDLDDSWPLIGTLAWDLDTGPGPCWQGLQICHRPTQRSISPFILHETSVGDHSRYSALVTWQRRRGFSGCYGLQDVREVHAVGVAGPTWIMGTFSEWHYFSSLTVRWSPQENNLSFASDKHVSFVFSLMFSSCSPRGILFHLQNQLFGNMLWGTDVKRERTCKTVNFSSILPAVHVSVSIQHSNNFRSSH